MNISNVAGGRLAFASDFTLNRNRHRRYLPTNGICQILIPIPRMRMDKHRHTTPDRDRLSFLEKLFYGSGAARACLQFYPLTDDRMRAIRAELKAHRGQINE